MESISQQRDSVLEKMLAHVPFDGWTGTALLAAGQDLGLDGAAIAAIFPRGAAQAAVHLPDWADRQTLRVLEAEDLASMKIRQRIFTAVKTRLSVLGRHRDAVRLAMRASLLSPAILCAPGQVWRTADVIWLAAGDTATDYNRYTKRALLSAVLVSTTLFWLNDSSEDFMATWNFLQQRIDDVLKFGQFISRLKPPFAKTA